MLKAELELDVELDVASLVCAGGGVGVSMRWLIFVNSFIIVSWWKLFRLFDLMVLLLLKLEISTRPLGVGWINVLEAKYLQNWVIEEEDEEGEAAI